MICWLDLETNGLDERKGDILEVALVVTDDDLNEVARTSVVVRPVPRAVPLEVHPVVQAMHEKNGLWRDVEEIGVRRFEAEELLCKFVKEVFANVPDVPTHICAMCGYNENEHLLNSDLDVAHCPGGDGPWSPKMVTALSQTPLAGSTISFDRRWIREQMPALERLFHYRSVDVSGFTEMAKRWSPEVYEGRPKEEKGAEHRALADIRASIEYLRYYRRVGFVAANLALTGAALREALLRFVPHPEDPGNALNLGTREDIDIAIKAMHAGWGYR